MPKLEFDIYDKYEQESFSDIKPGVVGPRYGKIVEPCIGSKLCTPYAVLGLTE